MSHENVEIVRQGVVALNQGDLEAILSFCTADSVVDASRRLFDPAVFTPEPGSNGS